MSPQLAARVSALDEALAQAERMTGRHDTMTTRNGAKLYVFDRENEARAVVFDFHDAAAFVALIGAGGTVRVGRSKTRIIWREGSELDSAAESYDRAAELMARRYDEVTP